MDTYHIEMLRTFVRRIVRSWNKVKSEPCWETHSILEDVLFDFGITVDRAYIQHDICDALHDEIQELITLAGVAQEYKDGSCDERIDKSLSKIKLWIGKDQKMLIGAETISRYVPGTGIKENP